MPKPFGHVERTRESHVLRDHRDRIRALEATAPMANYEIKVFSDLRVVTIGDGKFFWAIPEDLDDWYITRAHAFVSTVSSLGNIQVQIRNVTNSQDILSPLITIEVGEFTSYTAATQPIITVANSQVSTGDMMRIDVDAAGDLARGLGVKIRLRPALR